MMDINLTLLFEDFYHTRFFVFLCLGVFTLLFSLRLDNTIKWSYWVVFGPLWTWKATALLGMLVGSVCWCTTSRQRFEGEMFVQYKAMIISFMTQLILFLFEMLACENLEFEVITGSTKFWWVIVFVPLFILSLVSIGTCIWSIRHERSYELELFCALNVLQFVFIALRLDVIINWSWVLVFIPIWILMCISFVILLYLIIITIVVTRSQHQHFMQHHRASAYYNYQHHHAHQHPAQKWSNALCYVLLVLSLLTFEILLTTKLDQVMIHSGFHPNQQSPFLNNYNTYNFNQHQQPLQRDDFQRKAAPNNPNNLPQIYNRIDRIPVHQQPQQQQPQHQLYNPHIIFEAISSNLTSSSFAGVNNSTTSTLPPKIVNLKYWQPQQVQPVLVQPQPQLSYFVVTIPLYVAYVLLLFLSLNSHSGNMWWFGLRRDCCELFLLLCPPCRLYGNVQIKLAPPDDDDEQAPAAAAAARSTSTTRQPRRQQQQQPQQQGLLRSVSSGSVTVQNFMQHHQQAPSESQNASQLRRTPSAASLSHSSSSALSSHLAQPSGRQPRRTSSTNNNRRTMFMHASSTAASSSAMSASLRQQPNDRRRSSLSGTTQPFIENENADASSSRRGNSNVIAMSVSAGGNSFVMSKPKQAFQGHVVQLEMPD